MLTNKKSFKIAMEQANLQQLAGTGATSMSVNNGIDGWQTIWTKAGGVVVPAPTIPVGKNWELRIAWNASSTTALWTAAVTVVASPIPPAGDLAGDGKAAKAVSYATSGSYNDSGDFNMGPMPESNVTLRVKIWVTDYYNAGAPPDQSPTLW